MITCGVLLHRTQVGQDYFSPHQGCYYTSRALRSLLPPGLMNVCERKNLVSTRLPPEAAPDQADAAQASEFEVFCSTEFGFAAPAGVCGDKDM